MGRLPGSAFLAFFCLVSFWKWEVILPSVLSLVLTPVALIAGGGAADRWLSPSLVQYWLGAGVWSGVLLSVLKRCLAFFSGRNINSPAAGTALYPGALRPAASLNRRSLRMAGYVLAVVILAPALAGFDPGAQGDLRTGRLLKPLTLGYVEKTHESGVSVPAEGKTNGMENILETANASLLRRGTPLPAAGNIGQENANPDTRAVFLLGTDELGRDVFSRLLYALRLSVIIGILAVVCAIFIGCAVGFIAGMAGGWLDNFLMRCTDLFLAIPSLFLVIALVAFLGSSPGLLVLVLGVTGWMSMARLVRGEVLVLREREFIVAARMLGRSRYGILRDHMIPNVRPTIVVASIVQFGSVILAEAALSFLGLGIQPPTPSLGNMIGESLPYIGSAWWLGLFPGILLSVCIVSMNMIATRLRAEPGTAHA
jgi:peptide/nickel transport system permease protein